MHLLAGGNEDILPHIRAVSGRLAECSSGEQKRQDEATQSVCAQLSPKENQSPNQIAKPTLNRTLYRIRRSAESGSVSHAFVLATSLR
jgi:hypothetical protein